ncbi:hypothetical protein HG531_007824 [Fusarium graminearum]|nr:hypothetical protein HG531_007824 [Fusarium graminearum]
MIVQDSGTVESDVRLVISICVNVANCRGTRLEVVDQTFCKKRIVGQVDQMGHFLWSVQPHETFFDTDTKFLEGCLTFLVNFFGLQQLLLPCLVQIRQQLLTLAQLLCDLCLGDLLQNAVGPSDADHLLIQRCAFSVCLSCDHSSSRPPTSSKFSS